MAPKICAVKGNGINATRKAGAVTTGWPSPVSPVSLVSGQSVAADYISHSPTDLLTVTPVAMQHSHTLVTARL